MTNLLNKIIDVLPEFQKNAIKALMERKKKTGESPTIRSQQEQANVLYNRIKSNLGKILLNPRFAEKDQKISSSDHNKNMEEIYLDLNSLYSNIDQLAKYNSQQIITLNSEYDKSKAAIYKLINDAKVFALRKKYPEFNDMKVIDFNNSRNNTKKSPSAEINPNTRLLQLKSINFNRAHLLERGSRYTKVYTKTYAKGIKGALSKSFTPELIVDQKPESFWASLVMSDSPISQIYDVNTRNGESYKIAVDGPITEVYLQFSHIEQINTIRFLPFSEYPIKIIDVSYRSSPSSQIFFQVKDFISNTTLDWEELNFDSIYVYELRIVIAQENYKKVIYHLPKHLTINTDLFNQVFNSKAKNVAEDGLIPDSDEIINNLSLLDSYAAANKLLEELFIATGTDYISNPDLKYYDDISSIIDEIYSNIDIELKQKVKNKIIESSLLFTDQQSEIIQINKYEYILGMREIEAGHVIYSPISYYDSEKFNTQATISEVAIEVDERHPTYTTQWESGFRKTSIEWDIDLGAGRKIPIHPRNIVDEIDEIPAVKDERIFFEPGSNYAITRLGGYYSSIYRLKKDGNLIPSTDYSVIKVTGALPRLKITLTGDWLDSSIYTADYAVDPDSYNVQVLDKFDSNPLLTPEIFNSTGPDNNITLSKYPFINYEVINLTGYFFNDSGKSDWLFRPPQEDIASGHLRIFPRILDEVGNILQSGNVVGTAITGLWGTQSGVAPIQLAGNANLSSSYFGSIGGVSFGYFIKIMDSDNFVEVNQFTSATTLSLKEPFVATTDDLRRWDIIATGLVFSGMLTGNTSGYLHAEYKLGIGIKTDDQIFALSKNRYEPIVVTVGGKQAVNITNYETLQHPSFSVANRRDDEYQFIHAGKNIYFNQPNRGQEIKVQYNWITDYIALNGILRCNKLINPDVTPKVNEVRILINNIVI